jgi:predicted DCC family thiol-disulfide oxidoreductase YuxK
MATILFDGTCAFCTGAVRFIAVRDPEAHFRFGASQSPEAAPLLAQFGAAGTSARSVILIDNGQMYLRSTAVLMIASRLQWPWRLAGALLIVPTPVRDAMYRLVAALRYRLAGTTSVCEIPPPEIRARMI